MPVSPRTFRIGASLVCLVLALARPSAAQTSVVIDAPLAKATVEVPFTIFGWAADFAAASGTGVDAVHV